MAVIIRSPHLFLIVVFLLITFPEIKFTKGRLLKLMELKASTHIEGGRRKMKDSGSSNTHLVKQDTAHFDDDITQQTPCNKCPETSTGGYKTSLLDSGNDYLDNTKQGHSPGVGHPLVSSKEANKKLMENPNVEGKRVHDYSPGVGHEVPISDGYGKPEEASDYSPGVGHSIPPGLENRAAEVAVENNKKYLGEERFDDKKVVVIDSHSPGVGHSIQEKHAKTKS